MSARSERRYCTRRPVATILVGALGGICEILWRRLLAVLACAKAGANLRVHRSGPMNAQADSLRHDGMKRDEGGTAIGSRWNSDMHTARATRKIRR